MDWQWFLPVARSNDPHWRLGRRILDRGLRPGATASYHQMQQAKAHVLLRRLLLTPQQWEAHIELSVLLLPDSLHATELYGKYLDFKGS